MFVRQQYLQTVKKKRQNYPCTQHSIQGEVELQLH